MHNIYTANSRMCYIVHLSPVIAAEGTRSGSTACFSSAPCLGSCGSTVDGLGRSRSEQCAAGKPQTCIPETTSLYPWARCGPFTFFDFLKLEICHNDPWLIPLSSFLPVNPFTVWDSIESIDYFSQHKSSLCSVVFQLCCIVACVDLCWSLSGNKYCKNRSQTVLMLRNYHVCIFLLPTTLPPFCCDISLSFPVWI